MSDLFDRLSKPAQRKEARPHQLKAISGLRSSIRAGNKRIIIQLPTSAGKTFIAAMIIKAAREKSDSRIGFTVPTISLVNQTIEEFQSEGIAEIGAMQADHIMTDRSKPVQVISTGTLSRREAPWVNFYIVDECHINNSRIYELMLEKPDMLFIGLSATPWTRSLGIEGRWQDLVIPSTLPQLIKDGFICDFQMFAPDHPDLSKVKSGKNELGDSDYNQKQLSEVMSGPTLIKNVVNNWLDRGEGRPTMVFAVDRAHAQALVKEFEEKGVRTGYVDAKVPVEERELIKRQMETGELGVTVNISCLTTGISWPFISCLVLARPTRSQMLLVQIMGRGLRTFPEKHFCLYFDHTDSHVELGLFIDIYHDTLDTGKKQKKKKPEPLTQECQACHAVIPKGQTPCQYCEQVQYRCCASCRHNVPMDEHMCPDCGFGAVPQSDVNYVDGELIEIKGKRIALDTIRNFFAEMLYHARAHEPPYKDSYAWFKSKDRYGEQNLPHDIRKQAPKTPTTETLKYIKYLNIRNARSNKFAR